MAATDRPQGGDYLSERINRVLENLTGAERRVARQLLAGGAVLGLDSTAELAHRTGVSGPTVTRFVKKLGFADYGAFQAAVRDEIASRIKSPIELLDAGVQASSDDSLRTYFDANLADGVRRTFGSVPDHEFGAACQLLADDKRPATVVGGWSTHIVAQHLAAQLQQVRSGVRFIGSSYSELAAFAADADRRTTAVLFDFRRYEQRTIDLAAAVKSRGAQVVVVTDVWLSPAADVADAVLPCIVEGGGIFDTLVPALSLVEALVDATVRRIGAPALDRFERYNDESVTLIPRWDAKPRRPR